MNSKLYNKTGGINSTRISLLFYIVMMAPTQDNSLEIEMIDLLGENNADFDFSNIYNGDLELKIKLNLNITIVSQEPHNWTLITPEKPSNRIKVYEAAQKNGIPAIIEHLEKLFIIEPFWDAIKSNNRSEVRDLARYKIIEDHIQEHFIMNPTSPLFYAVKQNSFRSFKRTLCSRRRPKLHYLRQERTITTSTCN